MPTVEVGLPQKRCIYINFEKYYSVERPKAEARESYNIAPIQHPTDWMCALTRFHLPMGNMPMQERKLRPMHLEKAGLADIDFPELARTFSIGQLLKYLNDWARNAVSLYARTVPVGGVTQPLSLKFTLTESGSIMISSKLDLTANPPRGEIWTNGWTLVLDEEIAYLFAMEHLNDYSMIDDTGGAVTLVDRWDRVKGIRISAIGLPVQSEYLGGNTRGVILTDFLMPGNLTTTYTEGPTDATLKYSFYSVSFSEPPRQAIQYQPDEYRYLNLVGASRVDDVTIICEARVAQFDAASREFRSQIDPIFLPKGDPFTCKIGFFTKNMPEKKIDEHKNAMHVN